VPADASASLVSPLTSASAQRVNSSGKNLSAFTIKLTFCFPRRIFGKSATHGPGSPTVSGTKAVRADPTMQEVLAAFDRAERALEKQDLTALMQFYAPGYNYHGLHVEDVQRIWGEVFEHYRTLTSTHLFSEMKIVHAEEGLRVELTCTGGLYGADVQSGARVTLDSWFQEVHYLVRDKQGWRFLGNRGDAPRSAPFSSSPHHPLF